MLMSIQGEYYSSDYQLGLFEEKDKQCKKYGPNCGICSVISFSFQGCIKSEKNLKNHIASRMSYLKRYVGGAVGEIVSLEKPIKYLLITPEVVEDDCKYKRMMETQSRNDTHRYIFFCKDKESDELKKLLPYNDLNHARATILNMMRQDHYNPLIYYWLYDRNTGKVLRVRPKIDEVKTTTRNENDLLRIVPIYKFIYYGYGEDNK